MFKRILVVCIGNICRSPTAEALIHARYHSRGIQTSSAGLGAMVGKPMDASALAMLQGHADDFSGDARLALDAWLERGHVARQLDDGILAQHDLVLVMEDKHLKTIQTRHPQASGKTFLLGKWLDNVEIPDPYKQGTEAFTHVYGLIDRCVDSWDRYLR